MRRMESASDRAPGPMSGIPGELAAASFGSAGRAAHANLADALAADGRLGEAIPHYQEALQRSAEKAPWHVRLGRLYARTGDDSAALLHFREALAEEPAVRDLATRSAPAARLLATCAGRV
jgi:tetratricopeptide (TPR) repeat protein